MPLTSLEKVISVLLIIFQLYLLPVGEHNNQTVRNDVPKAMGTLHEDFLEPEPLKEDDKAEEILPHITRHLTPNLVEEARKVLNETEDVKQKTLAEPRRMIEGIPEPEPLKEDDKSEEILPLVMWHLTPALVEEARRELNETELKQTALVELRRMIEAEENLVSRTDDIFLLSFLRKYKFDVAKAFRCIQNYWIFMSDHEDIFANMNMERVLSLLRKNSFGLLEYRDREGCAVIIIKTGMLDPDEDFFEDIFLAITGLLRWSLEYEATQIAGYRIIFDFRDFGWKQLKFFAPSWVIVLMRGALYSSSGRYRRLHVLGESKVLIFLWGFLQPILPEEVPRLITFHGKDLEFLKDFIHPSVLPEEYGGLAPHFANKMDLVKQNFEKAFKILDYGYKN